MLIDTGSGTVTATAVITDGYHQRMDLTRMANCSSVRAIARMWGT